MGTTVFSPCGGTIYAAKRENCGDVGTVKINLDGGEIDLMITGVTLELSGNHQFLHTLNELVYFYSFGDRVGTLNISGMGFFNACGPEERRAKITRIYDEYYMPKRAANRTDGKAMDIAITGNNGTITVRGFLTGMRLDVSESQMGAVGYWSLRFDVLPT